MTLIEVLAVTCESTTGRPNGEKRIGFATDMKKAEDMIANFRAENEKEDSYYWMEFATLKGKIITFMREFEINL